jgi:hypothetical protein
MVVAAKQHEIPFVMPPALLVLLPVMDIEPELVLAALHPATAPIPDLDRPPGDDRNGALPPAQGERAVRLFAREPDGGVAEEALNHLRLQRCGSRRCLGPGSAVFARMDYHGVSIGGRNRLRLTRK